MAITQTSCWTQRCSKTIRTLFNSFQIIEERMRQKTQNLDGEKKRRPDFLDILLQQTEDNQMSVEEVREQVGNFCRLT